MKLRLVALVSIMAIVAGACSSAATPTPPAGPTATAGATPTAAPAAVKLTVWGRNYTVDPAKQRPWDPGPKAKLEAAHPGVTVDITGAPYDPQFQRIELSRAGQISDKPDVIQ